MEYWKNKVGNHPSRDLDPWIAVGSLLGLADYPGGDILVIPDAFRVWLAIELWGKVNKEWKQENRNKSEQIVKAIDGLVIKMRKGTGGK